MFLLFFATAVVRRTTDHCWGSYLHSYFLLWTIEVHTSWGFALCEWLLCVSPKALLATGPAGLGSPCPKLGAKVLGPLLLSASRLTSHPRACCLSGMTEADETPKAQERCDLGSQHGKYWPVWFIFQKLKSQRWSVVGSMTLTASHHLNALQMLIFTNTVSLQWRLCVQVARWRKVCLGISEHVGFFYPVLHDSRHYTGYIPRGLWSAGEAPGSLAAARRVPVLALAPQ